MTFGAEDRVKSMKEIAEIIMSMTGEAKNKASLNSGRTTAMLNGTSKHTRLSKICGCSLLVELKSAGLLMVSRKDDYINIARIKTARRSTTLLLGR